MVPASSAGQACTGPLGSSSSAGPQGPPQPRSGDRLGRPPPDPTGSGRVVASTLEAHPIVNPCTGPANTILLVEDDPDIARMYRFKLEHDGYRVCLARTGAGVARRRSMDCGAGCLWHPRRHAVVYGTIRPAVERIARLVFNRTVTHSRRDFS